MMIYKPYILLEDGWKLDLGGEFGSHEQARQCVQRRLKELKEDRIRVLIVGKGSNDKWRKLHKNWWKYRLIKIFIKDYKGA